MRKHAQDEERGSCGPKARLHSIQRQYHGIPRILRILIITVVVLVVARDVGIRIQGDFDYKLKILPTDFHALSADIPDALRRPEQPVLDLNGKRIGDRYLFMRHLETGNEGSASLYVDEHNREIVVVKTWLGAYKNIRNFVPGSLQPPFADYTNKWPSEIEASLLLESWRHGNDAAFVPVTDYFILRSSPDEWHWAMVTPYIEGGTLVDLAQATKFHERTPQKLDKMFRPAFNALLEKLGELHEAGYCHDDIKPDNIFIANTTQWLLGDLGNVRHISHPWHATARWKRENQKPDCTENDLRRQLKTYMSFLREAAASRHAFDVAFNADERAWSRLYWRFVDEPVPASALLELSKSLRAEDDREEHLETHTAGLDDDCLAWKTDRELTCWAVETSLWDWIPCKRC